MNLWIETCSQTGFPISSGYPCKRKLKKKKITKRKKKRDWQITEQGMEVDRLNLNYPFTNLKLTISVLDVVYPHVRIYELRLFISEGCWFYLFIYLFIYVSSLAKCHWLMKIYWHNTCRLLFHVAVLLSWEFVSRSWLKAIWMHSAIQIFKIYHAVFIGNKVWQDYVYTRNW